LKVFVGELRDRINAYPWKAGDHSGGFFAQDGVMELQTWLYRLRLDQPDAYWKVLAKFWKYGDALENQGAMLKRPKKVIERWLISEGALKSVAQQVMGGG
jgi:hypothetical protein